MDRFYTGEVVPGRGLAVDRMTPQIIMAIQGLTGGMRVVPGTLNLKLDRGLAPPHRWHVSAGDLGPSWEGDTGQSGYRIWKILIAGEIPALAMRAVEGGTYPELQAEIAGSVHLRTVLGLNDGDLLRFSVSI